jgi:pimeloyl-ACP methyl ester carboxylesterase
MTPHATTPTGTKWTAVTASDGTDLGIASLGSGPGLVVVHGSMQSAVSQLDLARMLAADRTVHLLERRGRGRSGPYPPRSSTATEVDDLAVVLRATGARAALGISSGALLVARAALTEPSLEDVLLFEPPLVVDTSLSLDFVERFRAELAADDLPNAMVTAMLGAQMGPGFLSAVPRALLVRMCRRQLAKDAAVAPAPGRVVLPDLVHALSQDFRIVTEQAGGLDDFRAIDPNMTRVLVMAGTRTRPYLRAAADALGGTVPGGRLTLLPGTNHGATQNRDQWGKPQIVADAVATFLTG